jgi:hypothetical protein
MTNWHPYPRYFVIPDRSWRGVAFIDDPLNTDGLYVGEDQKGDAPDWRDPDELDRNLNSDGVHRASAYEHEPFEEKIDWSDEELGLLIAARINPVNYELLRLHHPQRYHTLCADYYLGMPVPAGFEEYVRGH